MAIIYFVTVLVGALIGQRYWYKNRGAMRSGLARKKLLLKGAIASVGSFALLLLGFILASSWWTIPFAAIVGLASGFVGTTYPNLMLVGLLNARFKQKGE